MDFIIIYDFVLFHYHKYVECKWYKSSEKIYLEQNGMR